LLAWAALAGQVAFVAAWIVAGAIQPHYSSLHRTVSELAARSAAHPWIVTAGIVALAVAMAALGLALRAVLPRRPAATVTAVLFAAVGLCILLTATFPLDCGLGDAHCRHLWQAGKLSWRVDGHLWAAFAAEVFLTATPFAIARALWPSPVGAAALSSGVIGIVIGAISFGVGSAGAPDGLVERIDLFVLHLWVLILAVGVLYATRREPPPSHLIPLRPRDFLARSWTGEGVLLLRPLFLGRRLARPFGARRQATWISEGVWRVDDEADFGGGRVQRRVMFCEFVADDHVRITAGDLPDGADVWLEEGGYRTSSFRVNFPIGPVPVLLRCHDLSYVESDGTFVNAIEARSLVLGIPLARVVFRVRPVDRTERTSAAERDQSGLDAQGSLAR
jgi:hypothetical protein